MNLILIQGSFMNDVIQSWAIPYSSYSLILQKDEPPSRSVCYFDDECYLKGKGTIQKICNFTLFITQIENFVLIYLDR